MSLGILEVGIIMLVVVVALVLFRRKATESPPDYDNENQILDGLQIYVAYGRNKEAIEFLEKASRARPHNEVYRKKLQELKSGAA